MAGFRNGELARLPEGITPHGQTVASWVLRAEIDRLEREKITPRPGESMTAALVRVLDPDSGSGLSWLDKIALKERDDQAEQKWADEHVEL